MLMNTSKNNRGKCADYKDRLIYKLTREVAD